MRWPLSWLFRAAAPVGNGGDAPTGDGGGSAVPPDPAAGAPLGRLDRPAWRDIPPIRTAIGEPPVTAPLAAFDASLAGRHRPAPILEPLGHEVRADGPAGLVGGLASSLVAPAPASPARTGGPPLVSRRAGGRQAAADDTGIEASPAAGPAPEALQPPSLEPAGSLLPDVAPRVLPVVAAEAVTPALGATAVAASSAPPLVRPLAPLVGTLVPAAPSQVQPGGEGAGVGGEPAAAAAPAAPTLPPAAVPLARRTLGESRRLGLGPPLASRPSMLRLSEEARETATAASSAAVRGAPMAAAPVPLPPARAAEAALPALTLARAVAGPAAASAPAGSGSLPGPGPWIAPLAGPRPIVPVPGARPLAGAFGAEGTPEPGDAGAPEGGAPGAGTVGHDAAEALPVRASPAPADGDRAGVAPTAPGAPAALDARTAGPVGSIPAPASPLHRPAVARLAADRAIQPCVTPSRGLASVAPAGPEGRTPAPVVARLIVPPGPAADGSHQRAPGQTDAAANPAAEPAAAFAPGGSGPAAGPSPGAPVDASAPARAPVSVARLATAVGRAPEIPDLPVARLAAAPAAAPATFSGASVPAPGPDAGGRSIPVTPPGGEPAIQRLVEAPSVQRAVTIGEVQSEVTPEGGGAAGGAAGGGNEQDLDALAGRLYGRIRDRLADELLADRERAGLIADL